jgi:hypothetical protein
MPCVVKIHASQYFLQGHPMPRTLKITISQEVGPANPAQIEAYKALWIATFEPCGMTPTFEIEEVDEYERVKAMLRLVRSEFQASDEEPDLCRGCAADLEGVPLSADELPDLCVDEP